MILPEDRQLALELIKEAVESGARQARACEILEIAERTLRRWKKQLKEEQQLRDRRKAAASQRTSANKLTEAEKDQIIDICNRPEYQSLPPSQRACPVKRFGYRTQAS